MTLNYQPPGIHTFFNPLLSRVRKTYIFLPSNRWRDVTAVIPLPNTVNFSVTHRGSTDSIPFWLWRWKPPFGEFHSGRNRVTPGNSYGGGEVLSPTSCEKLKSWTFLGAGPSPGEPQVRPGPGWHFRCIPVKDSVAEGQLSWPQIPDPGKVSESKCVPSRA